MKLKSILASTLVIAALASCVKHEVIPAPEPKVDLVCNFTGTINGTDVEWTQNVDGFYLESSKSKIVPPSGLSSAIYYSEIKSTENLNAMRLNIGQMKWDANVTSDPTLSIFNGFLTANPTPTYTLGAILTGANTAGFEVAYRDGNGDVWLTKDTDPNTIDFTNIVQESDKTGDYSKFIANFDCTVYHTFQIITPSNPPAVGDTTYVEQSLPVNNGVFKGWYKR
jgi:hypothetical protein